ncbi:MAG: hypothetical protein JJT76_18930 [Clostridiaceae bacterium]|nr:hypothetical protein [Clostridiaceae bacterium]
MNTVEPIRDRKKIEAVKKYLIGCGKTPDFCLFTVGINTDHRVSDFLRFVWGDVLDKKGKFIGSIYIREGEVISY